MAMIQQKVTIAKRDGIPPVYMQLSGTLTTSQNVTQPDVCRSISCQRAHCVHGTWIHEPPRGIEASVSMEEAWQGGSCFQTTQQTDIPQLLLVSTTKPHSQELLTPAVVKQYQGARYVQQKAAVEPAQNLSSPKGDFGRVLWHHAPSSLHKYTSIP